MHRRICGRPRLALSLPLLVCALVLLQGCKTQRTVKNVRSSISFDPSIWGEGTGDDREKLRERFGTSYEEATSGGGRRSAFEGKGYRGERGAGEESQKSAYRDGSRQYRDRSEARLPEYMRRNETYRTGTAQEGRDGQGASEDGFRYREAGDRYADAGKEPGFLSRLNPFRWGQAPESGETYRTEAYNTRRPTVDPVPTPSPALTGGGYQEEGMTVDDVRKLLNPGSVN